jgi:hypothetical protein
MTFRRAGAALVVFAILVACRAQPSPALTGGSTKAGGQAAAGSAQLPPAPTSGPIPPTPTTVPPLQPGEVRVGPSGGDDTAALMAAVRDNPVVVVDQPLHIDQVATFTASDRTITFRGQGALVRSVRPETVTFQVMHFAGARNVTLNNPVVVGPALGCDRYDARYEEQHAIALSGVDGFRINGGLLSNIPGDGVFIFYDHRPGPNNGQPSRNVVIDSLTTVCTGRSSISNVAASNVFINGGFYDKAGMWIFNIEPFNTRAVENVLVNRPRFGLARARWLYVGGPNFRCGITRVTNVVFVGAQGDPRNAPASVIGCATGEVRILP